MGVMCPTAETRVEEGRRGRQEVGTGGGALCRGHSVLGGRGAEGRDGNYARPGKLQGPTTESFALQAENLCLLWSKGTVTCSRCRLGRAIWQPWQERLEGEDRPGGGALQDWVRPGRGQTGGTGV